MSSFNIEAVRKYYQDPILQILRELSKRVAKQESENIDIETDDITGLGDYDHTLLRYTDHWNFIKKYTIPTVHPQLPFEPDFDKLALDLRFDHLGDTLTDYSGLENHAEIFGEPCPADGTDVGYRGGPRKNTAHEIQQEEQIYYRIPDTAKLRIVGKTTGHSFYTRVNLKTLNQSNLRDQTFYEKYDDANNAVSLRIDPNGAVKYFVRRAGTDYYVKTANSVITANNNYEIGFTYAVSGNVQHIYVNDVDKSLSANAETAFYSTGTPDSFIGTRGDTDKGFCDVNMIDMLRFYDEKVLTSTQIHNLFTNHISISDIAAGNVFIFDATVFTEVQLPSFSDVSFTDTSFTT